MENLILVILIFGALIIFAIYYDTKIAPKFMEKRKNKYIISIMEKDGYNKKKEYLTNLKEFYLYKEMNKPVEKERIKLSTQAFHITGGCTFKIAKNFRWEKLHNNFFMNRLPLRLLKRLIKQWNWYNKLICFFPDTSSSQIIEGYSLDDTRIKTPVATGDEITVIVETDYIKRALKGWSPGLSLGGKKTIFVLIASIGIGAIIYLYMMGYLT